MSALLSPTAQSPLMQLVALQSLICVVVAELLGCSASAMALPFPTDLRGIPATPAPAPLTKRVHPLMSFSSTSESMTGSNLPGTRGHQVTSLEISPPIATLAAWIH
jgi:hypothetical protein